MNLLEHKKARLTYEMLKEFDAGIELFGFEVKALRAGFGRLDGSHVIIRPSGHRGGFEGWLVGASIPPYQAANTPLSYDPARSRRLLMTKKELTELASLESQKGLTIVPLVVYDKGGLVKIKVAAARGRKKYDKRDVLKKRDAERDIRRTLKTGERD
jgi:SsrA-binding protein